MTDTKVKSVKCPDCHGRATVVYERVYATNRRQALHHAAFGLLGAFFGFWDGHGTCPECGLKWDVPHV